MKSADVRNAVIVVLLLVIAGAAAGRLVFLVAECLKAGDSISQCLQSIL